MKISRKQAVGNFLWKLAEQLGSQVVSFFVSIILARLLLPEDYSVVSIIVILSSFCSVFVDGGLSKALIQKKDSDEKDFSTVFLTTLFMAAIIYAGLFVAAPYVAKVYSNDFLIPVIRVYALSLIISAFSTVQSAYISKNLQFKKYFLATITGTIFSAAVGISMAYQGYGAWALVAQKMSNLVINTIILFITSTFRPRLYFSVSRLKSLWKYGSKVLGTSLLDMVYDNIRPLVVGLKFNTVDLAYYEKGKSYPGMLNSTISSTLASVLFPVIATAQDDITAVRAITQRYIRVASFLVFPALLGLAAIADNLVLWMLTDKWTAAVPYMRVFCVNFMFLVLQTGNLQAINAIGRSDIVLKLAVKKKTINFVLLFVVIIVAKSPLVLASLGIVTSLIAFVLNSFANKKILKYGFKAQICDILPNLVCAVVMMYAVMLVGRLNMPMLPLVVLQVAFGGAVYIVIAKVTRNTNLIYCWDMVKSLINK